VNKAASDARLIYFLAIVKAGQLSSSLYQVSYFTKFYLKFSILDSGKLEKSYSSVIAVFADKHGMNVIISDGLADCEYTLFRLYKNHWIKLQELKMSQAFETYSYSVMPVYMPIIISGRFFLFGEAALDPE